MPKYLMIFSHCIIQFSELDFAAPFQPELLIDEADSFLCFPRPFYQCLLELLYRQVMPLSLNVDTILG